MKTILAPVDFSAATDSVVQAASSLARALGGRVVLLSVIQPPVMMSEYAPLMQDIAEVTAAGEKNAARRLAKLEAKVKSDFIRVESVVTTGAPVTRILEEAEEAGATYIVMGSHGHTALYDLLVGSTSHGVLLRSKVPVLIVPPGRSAKPRKVQAHETALV